MKEKKNIKIEIKEKQNQAHTYPPTKQFNLRRMAHVAIRHSCLCVLLQNPLSQAQVTQLQLPRSNQLVVFRTWLSQVADQLIGAVYLSDHLHLAFPKSPVRIIEYYFHFYRC
jgi:hypothetical protein